MVAPLQPVTQGSPNVASSRQQSPPLPEVGQGDSIADRVNADCRPSPNSHDNNSQPESKPRHPPAHASVSASVPTLRFPRPQGSRQLAIWVSSSSPDIMASPPSSQEYFENSLSESSFEFISRENEETNSQDGQAESISESLPDLERYPHPDDVQVFTGPDDMSISAASTAATDSESEFDQYVEHEDGMENQDEDSNHSRSEQLNDAQGDADDILRQSLCDTACALPNLSDAGSVNSSEIRVPDETNMHIDKVSVKHTVKELGPKEAAWIFEKAGLGSVPDRVSATIRQTMCQSCLSTQEAFRVLYIGDESSRAEIIFKVSRAITCSTAEGRNQDKLLRPDAEGVYNIVPVTFGAMQEREVELMEATGFQIKVDTCIDAEIISLDSRFFKDEVVYSVSMDSGKRGKNYKSVPAAGPLGARITPSWNLAHIAIFYCSEDDDGRMQEMQQIAWKFCGRHNIPALFISELPAFDSAIATRWLNYTNEHAVCLSLETRESKNELRFPIDHESFLNIDNRQMNQNLAYLTGLQEPSSPEVDPTERNTLLVRSAKGSAAGAVRTGKDTTANPPQDLVWGWKKEQAYNLVVAILGMLMAWSFLEAITLYYSHSPAEQSGMAPERIRSVAATATITINHTSTKTVIVAETPTFGGLLSDIAHTVSSDGPKNTVCSVQQYSDNEILLRLSSGTKETWLAKGAIDIDVYRGEVHIPAKLSSVSEGIIIQIPEGETRGVVNVSIVTTRKPKINETFAVDFGPDLFRGIHSAFSSAQALIQGAAHDMGDAADRAFKSAQQSIGSVLASADEQLVDTADSLWHSVKDGGKLAHEYSLKKAEETYAWVKNSIHPDEAATYLQNVQQLAKEQRRKVEDLRDTSKLAIVKAQIASKLWWLKMQGLQQEHEDYERQARAFMSKKYSEAATAKKARRAQPGRSGDCEDKRRWRI
ncbi:hypothetical protein BD289DRAFT_428051 [Coniella lustricola]|uniref:Uncharacterized protein n=1 Tax=Coniella lustricola TaxID=2025994 RepID=A0A2T3AEL4_9PEZI|nr:hypothetical protein BD289DRAFT_428051 [Coniella lustricola]